MAKGILPRLILTLVLLTGSIIGAVLCAVGKLYIIGALLLLVAIWSIVLVIQIFKLNTSKASFMFNAIENDDFTLQFSENMRSHSDRMFNRSLNRIKELMQQTRNNIAQREKYYETILDHSTSGIIVIEPGNGIVFQTNRAVEQLLGVGQLTHVNQLSIVSPDVTQALMNIKPNESQSVSFYNETTKVCLTLSASMVRLNDRELKIVAMSDIGGQIDNTQTESWMRLSRVLTHEIMNSLAPITSLSEQLRTTTDHQTIQHGLDIISTTSKGLISFVDNYRRLTRIPTPVIRDVCIVELLRKQVSLLDSTIDMSGVTAGMRIMADENLIAQVLTNLLKNAIEATRQYGKVWVTSYYDRRGRTAIEICNTGEPISEEIRDNIFVPFFTTKQGGSGIGLSLSRQIMRLHNGTLTYARDTRNPWNITRFILLF